MRNKRNEKGADARVVSTRSTRSVDVSTHELENGKRSGQPKQEEKSSLLKRHRRRGKTNEKKRRKIIIPCHHRSVQ